MGFTEQLGNVTCAKIFFNEPMDKHTTLRVGGFAKYYAKVNSLHGLNQLLLLCKSYNKPYKVLGNGTNLLISDKGYSGLIIDMKQLSDVYFKRDEVRVSAGAGLDKLIKFAYEHRLSGIEALSGIPATIGGAIVMNAGAFGHNISDCLTTVETLSDGKINVYSKEDCKFGYRRSRFLGKKEVIIFASFKLVECEREIIHAGMKTYLDLRKTIQPSGNSCGSVFKNPKPSSAGALIERAGLKGYRIGGATISEKHGNFIITERGAKAKDVYLLIKFIKEKIKEVFGVELVEEVEYVGEF